MKKSLIFISIMALVTFIFSAETRAQTTSNIIVAPSRQEILVDPGEKTVINVKFLNQGETPVSGPLGVVDFIVEDKEGTPTFLEETPAVTGITQISPRFSAASWVTLPYERITIASKGKVLIQAKIQVPVDAHPGGRYLAVYFEPGGAPTEATGALKEAVSPVSARVVALVYLRVSGPVKEDARVIRFSVPQFSQYGPVPVTAEILNQGDYHLRPKGLIKVINLWGKTVDQQNLVGQNIFPDASRIYENKVGSKWMFGKYRAELNASYGETGKVLTAVAFFWVIPYKEITAGVLAIIIIILLIYFTYRRFIRHERKLKEKIEKLEEKLEEKNK